MTDDSTRTPSPVFRRDARTALLLAILTVAPWMPAIVRGAIPFYMDTVTQFYPWRRLAGVLLHSGIAPFWNPSAFGGVPLLSNPQVGALYPGHWPLLLSPETGMFTATAALHVVIAALGLFFWLRWMRVARWAAAVGALALAWNGWTWAHFAFGSYHAVWAWWPWQFWLLLAWTRRAGFRWPRAAVILGFLLALQLLAGAPQLVYYGLLASALIVLIAWATGPRPLLPAFGRLLLGATLAGVLALAWAAPQLLPAAAFFRECSRVTELSLDDIRSGALSIDGIARALLGGTGFPEDAESIIYFGALWIALAVAGIAFHSERRVPVILAAVALLGCLLAWRPLTGAWSAILPGFSHLHDPRRALALLSIAIPFLGALGLDALRRALVESSPPRAALWITTAGLFVIVLLSAWFLLDLRRVPAPPEGISLHPALGWLPTLSGITGWVELGVVGVLVAAGIVFALSSWRAAQPRLASFVPAVLAAAGLVFLLVFAFNRIDLKTRPLEGPGAMLDELDRVRARLESSLPRDPGSPARPLRVVAFDPTGDTSYNYTRPDASAWLLPGLAALTWSSAPDSPLNGLCDLQGYDPALPRRWTGLLSLVNDGHIALFPRHFALLRAPRSPLLARLSPDAAIGPVDRYVAPVLPPVISPGQTRAVFIEETAPYATVRLRVSGHGQVPRRIRMTFLDSTQNIFHREEVPLAPAAFLNNATLDLVRALPVGFERVVSFHFTLDAPPDSPPLQVLVFLERKNASDSPWTPLETATTSTLQSARAVPPDMFKFSQPSSYLHVVRDVRVVPPDEDPDAIGRVMKLYPRSTVLEWPPDQDPPRPLPVDSAGDASPGSAQLDSWKPGHLIIDATVVSPDGAALVLREPYYRGWRVRVDDQPLDPIPADLAFQAVWLAPGTHRVEWLYQPPGFRGGLIAALLATGLAVGLVFVSRSREKRTPTSAASTPNPPESGS